VVTPLRRLAFHTTTTCSAQASVYGKCILESYTDVKEDTCKEEFAKFGECIREAVGTLRSHCGLSTESRADETEMVMVYANLQWT
jgi:hypothetical protein